MCFNLTILAKDTLNVKTQELNIEAKKNQQLESRYFQSTKISDTLINSINPLQMTDAIKVTSGMYLSDYGGIGGVKTISMRGLAANNTLVLLDGVRINSIQNGSFDFSSFFIGEIEEIEVNKGGNSAFYGGNATAGIIDFKTHSLNAKSKNHKIEMSYGNLKDYLLKYNTNIHFGDNNLKINLGHIFNQGNYTFQSQQFGQEITSVRENSEFSNFNVHFNFSNYKNISNIIQNIDNKIEYNFNLLINSTKRGVPGPVLQNLIENSDANLNEKDINFISSVNIPIDLSKTVTLKGLVKYNEMNYIDKNALYYSNTGLNNEFLSNDYFLKAEYSEIAESYDLKLNSEFGHNILRGDMLDAKIDYAKRNLFSLSFVLDKNLSELSQFIDNIRDVSIISSLRYDNYNDFGSFFSPLIGINYKLNEINTDLKMNYSYNFRPPSFNELYYLNLGNTDLSPEKSNSYNIVLNNKSIEKIELNLNYSLVNTENRILSIPKSPVVWSTYNLGSVEVNSIEIDVKYNFNENLITSFGYLFQNALDKTIGSQTYNKQLPYSPNEIINFNLMYFSDNLDVNLLNRYNSYRYFTANNNNNEFLPNFVISDLNINYKFDTNKKSSVKNIIVKNNTLDKSNKYIIYIVVSNIFNEEFSLISNYPMPGRLIRGGVKLEF